MHLMTKGNNFSFSAAPGGIKLLDGISQVGINSQGCIKALLQSVALVFPERIQVCVCVCVLVYLHAFLHYADVCVCLSAEKSVCVGV